MIRFFILALGACWIESVLCFFPLLTEPLRDSPDPFHASAIIVYLNSFEFAHDPIDLALRKLLMAVSLPKETQQIDRVMEAFSKRYMACNTKLYSSSGTNVALFLSRLWPSVIPDTEAELWIGWL